MKDIFSFKEYPELKVYFIYPPTTESEDIEIKPARIAWKANINGELYGSVALTTAEKPNETIIEAMVEDYLNTKKQVQKKRK